MLGGGDIGERPAAAEPPLRGGDPGMWDGLHTSNERGVTDAGLYPLRSAPERELLRFLLERGSPGAGEDLVELGCGATRYLPYVAIETGAQIHGVDFSAPGIRQTRRALEAVGSDPSGIVEGTIEAFVEKNRNRFDVVSSFGLIEHFDDLAEVIAWHTACARPGGRIVITAPNFNHVNLGWTRRVAPDLFSWHRRIEPVRAAELLAGAGAGEVQIEYLGGPRLFAYPQREGRNRWQHLNARITRKAFNGVGEAFNRVSARTAQQIAGERLSPFFALSAIHRW